MKKIKQTLFLTFFLFCCGKAFSQSADSLSVSPTLFSSSCTIHFELAKSDTITLQVYSIPGQLMSSFYQSTILPSGSYNVNLLGDAFPEGVYLVRLDIGSTKTMIKKAIKIGSTLGLEDKKTTDKISIFPNPTTDQITIPMAGEKMISVADLNGNIITSYRTNQQTVSLSNFPAGQYIISIINSQNEKLTSRIMLIRE